MFGTGHIILGYGRQQVRPYFQPHPRKAAARPKGQALRKRRPPPPEDDWEEKLFARLKP
jgi:hypothetical protein